MENPFSLKFGQVFTGVGVGCGIGIGIGRPIYFGAISALQPVISAARGATDALSSVSKHANYSLRMLGMKRFEAGVGCGVGIGHGFGAGIALRPWVLPQIQTSITESVIKITMHMGLGQIFSFGKKFFPGSLQSSAYTNNPQSSVGDPLNSSKAMLSAFQHSKSDRNIHSTDLSDNLWQKNTFSTSSLVSRTEKVIDNFLQSPAIKNEVEVELNDAVRNLRTENNMLQLVLKHQEIIEKLMDENQKLRKVLIEDLRIPPHKFQQSISSNASFKHSCIDCFECRRRRRKMKL